MFRLVPVVLLLASVASAQGVPRPPAFNPVTDSPHTVGQPGYIGPTGAAPRSPHKRVLPSTKEPGVWAASAGDDMPPVPPKGSPRPTFAIAGVPLDLGGEVQDGMDATSAGWCVAVLESGLADATSHLMARISALRDEQRACVVRAAFYFCMHGITVGTAGEAIYRRIPADVLGDDDRARVRHRADDIRRAAERNAARACANVGGGLLDLAGDLVGGTRPKGPLPWIQ